MAASTTMTPMKLTKATLKLMDSRREEMAERIWTESIVGITYRLRREGHLISQTAVTQWCRALGHWDDAVVAKRQESGKKGGRPDGVSPPPMPAMGTSEKVKRVRAAEAARHPRREEEVEAERQTYEAQKSLLTRERQDFTTEELEAIRQKAEHWIRTGHCRMARHVELMGRHAEVWNID